MGASWDYTGIVGVVTRRRTRAPRSPGIEFRALSLVGGTRGSG